VRVLALAAGLAAGAANCALLAAGCRRLGKRRAWPWFAGGIALPIAGLALCAVLLPAALPWFGCACGGALVLSAVVWATIHAKHL